MKKKNIKIKINKKNINISKIIIITYVNNKNFKFKLHVNNN